MPEHVDNYLITPHAAYEMKRRSISEEIIRRVLSSPEQTVQLRPGRKVMQTRIKFPDSGKIYLVRVFVDTNCDPVEVVTAYRTSKIIKYWREKL